MWQVIDVPCIDLERPGEVGRPPGISPSSVTHFLMRGLCDEVASILEFSDVSFVTVRDDQGGGGRDF